MSWGRQLVIIFVVFCYATLTPVCAQQRARIVEHSSKQASNPSAKQEQSDEIVRVHTRVVFIDVLVKDKRTGEPVRDLTRDDFHVFDNGKPRTLTYFSREGEVRRPLAVVLFLNLGMINAGRYFGMFVDPDDGRARASLTAALTKLSPEDEVAVMLTADGLGAKPVVLTELTHDREKVIAAFARVKAAFNESLMAEGWHPVMTEAVEKAIELTRHRPDAQVVFVYVSDGFDTFDMGDLSERPKLASKLIEHNISFHALTFRMLKGLAVFSAAANVLFWPFGESFTGSEEFLAKQTGGEVVKVRRPEELGTGLERITNDLAARYSLGFTLDENERDDGRMHRLEVKVKARDARGKERKLIVYARRGYYAPKQGISATK